MTKRMTLLFAALLAGCLHTDHAGQSPDGSAYSETAETAVASATNGASLRTGIVPLLDAHQHLMGPAAMSTLTREPSPTPVTLPPALEELLRAREGGVNEANYAEIFTPDAQVFAEEQGRWWTGEASIRDSIGNFGNDHRFVPTSFAADGSAGFVSGVLESESEEETHNFILGLRQGGDGRWRIASEMKQPVMPPIYAPLVSADRVIEVLDDAGIRYATVLSVAYWFGDPDKPIALQDRIAGMRAENDWVIAQARRYEDRLVPFCGVNPVTDYAVAEMERCADLGVRGMKIHRNSKYDPGRPEDLDRLRQFFRAANRLGMAIVIHLRGDTRLYIDHIFPEAPDIPIQIAHMGSGWGNAQIFADAIQADLPGTQNLWFDWTQALPIEGLWGYGPSRGLSGSVSPEDKEWVVDVMRRIGLDRILFGTDMPLPWNPSPRVWWRETILTLPLTDEEVRDIADNVPPYLTR